MKLDIALFYKNIYEFYKTGASNPFIFINLADLFDFSLLFILLYVIYLILSSNISLSGIFYLLYFLVHDSEFSTVFILVLVAAFVNINLQLQLKLCNALSLVF